MAYRCGAGDEDDDPSLTVGSFRWDVYKILHCVPGKVE